MKSVFLISSSLLVFLSLAIPAKAESRHSVIISGQVEENITFIQWLDHFDILSNIDSGAGAIRAKIHSEDALVVCARI